MRMNYEITKVGPIDPEPRRFFYDNKEVTVVVEKKLKNNSYSSLDVVLNLLKGNTFLGVIKSASAGFKFYPKGDTIIPESHFCFFSKECKEDSILTLKKMEDYYIDPLMSIAPNLLHSINDKLCLKPKCIIVYNLDSYTDQITWMPYISEGDDNPMFSTRAWKLGESTEKERSHFLKKEKIKL